jgi:hypothetical protein
MKALLTVALCGVPELAEMLAALPKTFVRLKLADADNPVTLALTVYEPVCELAASAGAMATPLALVVTVVVADPLKLAEAPLTGAVKVTLRPLIGLLLASLTIACRAVLKVLEMLVLCGVPAVAAMLTGIPATLRFVKLKLVGALTPAAAALTLNAPGWEFATSVGAVAMPLAFVVAVAVDDPLNAPPGPEVGAVNVTMTPLTGLPAASSTVACKAVAKAVPAGLVCALPPVAAILAAAPGRLVSAKLAGVETPAAVAVTL